VTPAPRWAVAIGLVALLAACGSQSRVATCDDYAGADPIARKMMISDELQRHGLDYARSDLHLKVNEAIAQHCGPLDPFGHVKAKRNGDEPFSSSVNWAGLQP